MTTLLYLENTYNFKGEAQIISISETEFGIEIILDQTLFYPQGGGQPCDTGMIKSTTGTFQVHNVRIDNEGIVHHYGQFQEGCFSEGDQINITIDQERRLINSKCHSAGHMLDIAVKEVIGNHLVPIKVITSLTVPMWSLMG